MHSSKRPGTRRLLRTTCTLRPRRPLWRAVALVLALAMLPWPIAAVAAQDAVPSDSSAWWASFNAVDPAVRCPAMLAWLQAIDVEQRDEEQGTADQLADVATGAELIREQQRLSTAPPPSERQWAAYLSWTVVGGTPDEVVIYATRTVRTGPADAAGAERLEAEAVDTVQAAYRLVLVEEGTWRLADRHVFEQGRHAVDPALAREVVQRYQQLIEGLVEAFNARDVDALRAVLDGAALEQYLAELQQLADQQDHGTVEYSGRLGLIDVEPSGAVLLLDGTRTYAQPETAPGGEVAVQTDEPVTLVHRLAVLDGQWKIVDEAATTTRRDADGTEHVQGCS